MDEVGPLSNAQKRKLLATLKPFLNQMNEEKAKEVEAVRAATGHTCSRNETTGNYEYVDKDGSKTDAETFSRMYAHSFRPQGLSFLTFKAATCLDITISSSRGV